MIIGRTLTPKQALDEILCAKRLVFGNESQIQAIKTLRLAEQLIGTERTCPDCDGEGEIEGDGYGECDRCGRECSYCHGDSEFEECERCDGSGEATWLRDEVYRMSSERIILALNEQRIELAA